MTLCFSLAKNDDCSLFDRTSLTWVLKPGQSKILRRGEDVVQYIENPLRFPQVNTWEAVSSVNKEFVVIMYFNEEQFGTEKSSFQLYPAVYNIGLTRNYLYYTSRKNIL